MAGIPSRNRPIRQMALGLAIVGALVGAGFTIAGLISHANEGDSTTAALLVVAGFILFIFALFLYGFSEIAFTVESNINRMRQASEDMLDVARRIEPRIQTLAQNSHFSDAAKSIAHREVERDALRQAIREEMYSGDIEAANYLISEMERRFGYRHEAEKLQQEMVQMREMTIEEKINEAISHIQKLMDEHHWGRAANEAERLMKLFPKHERVAALPSELSKRRDTRKQALLAEWTVAVQREEIDRGIALLTELDQYLSVEEAQALQDSARHVFKARLVNLGVRFGLAVSEARWRDALEAGLQIVEEFPNSRMAREVSEKLETLRLRAGFVADADIVQRRDNRSES